MANEKRLIDAWDLIEWLDDFDRENTLRVLRCKKARLLNSHAIRNMIVNAPTVEAVEVVHGRWEDIYGGKYANPRFRCSVCKVKALYVNVLNGLGNWIDEQELSNYCPNCGAKMDGDGNG